MGWEERARTAHSEPQASPRRVLTQPRKLRREPGRVKLESLGLQKWAETQKADTRVLGPVTRHLLGRDRNQDRAHDVMHPSEIVKSDWCGRHDYYRIKGYPAEEVDDTFASLRMEAIFGEGHEIHRKWQDWLRELGVLRGTWACIRCYHQWEDTSPKQCPECGTGGWFAIRYREVTVDWPEYMIGGKSDGDIDDGRDPAVLEIKSIGVGTLRFDAPELLHRFTHKFDVDGKEKTFIDYDGIWSAITRPFPAHLKQATIYALAKGYAWIVFIYECKWNQAHKEFLVKVNSKWVEDILEECADVAYAVRNDRPPGRPHWAEGPEGKICRSCPYNTICWSADGEKTSNGSSTSADASSERPRLHLAESAEVRTTRGTDEPGRPDRPGPHGVVHALDAIRQLFEHTRRHR